jgi:hypothetical protein
MTKKPLGDYLAAADGEPVLRSAEQRTVLDGERLSAGVHPLWVLHCALLI